MSLSRFQLLAWTLVLFGGYTVLGAFNVAQLATYVRDTLQAQVVSGGSETTIEEFVGFFPSMDNALWAVLGITVAVSPLRSQFILNRKPKASEDGTLNVAAIEARPLVAGGPLEMRDSATKARWSDLITGEEEANAGQVDVSRLQYLVITFLLLGSYIVLLIEYVRRIDGAQVLLASASGAPVFPAMPPVDGTFLGLLVLSHGGYLAFKAMPATNSGGPTG